MKPLCLGLLGAALLLAAPLKAQDQPKKQTPPEGGTPKDFSLPAKEEFKLDNGLQATLVPYGNVPKVTVTLAVQAGNVHEPAGQTGIADLLGRMLREGTRSMSAQEMAEKVARMGGSLDVSVGSNQTMIWASSLSEFGPELVNLLAEMVQHPTLPAAELPRLKADFKRQVALMRAQPSTQAQQKFLKAMYPNHPYGNMLPTDAEIDAMTLEQVQAFYQSQYGAQRSNIYVAGKFDDAAMRKAITQAFSPWPQGPAPSIPLAKPVTRGQIMTQDRPGAPQSTIVMGLPVIDPTNPDYLRLRVTNSLLGGSFGSRVTRNIREDKGYTYSPYSYISPRYRAGEWAQVADVTTQETGNSLKEIVYEIERLQKQAPSDDELKGIQNYEAGLFILRNSNPGGIINQLNFLDLHGLPDSYLTDQVKNTYAVTPQQVSETVRKYIRPESMTIVVVGDKKVIDPQIKKFQATRKKAL
ncbi:M16 family metallopeptidase [Hymenobacter latericus]|uniref:M16 family metallopeptidase n=1 Tax=Hymenobacter sp. YIM 151858-1 TaxID=2987688 RepID=UPI002226C04C|nr:pitrilysin family protein [Hymenobacter sp. YIM 151858-1]UYZ58191.1 insulinase family protein [Hymenobacter sp. YIM 151858-1]